MGGLAGKRNRRRYVYRDNDTYYVYDHDTLHYDTTYGGQWRGDNSEHHFAVCFMGAPDWEHDSDMRLAPGEGPVEITIDIKPKE